MRSNLFKLAAVATLAPLVTACGELEGGAQDRMGNYDVEYVDNLRVYINDELVAEVVSGEDATVEWNGENFEISQLCSDEGVMCPSESYWTEIAVDQPWGVEYDLLNFVNLSEDRGTPGQRMGGELSDDGGFVMLAGLAVGGEGACAALGVGTVEGLFAEDNSTVDEGVIAYEWAAGCVIGEATISGTLRLETDYTAVRSGDYDISSVTPEEPIDSEGSEVDPDEPDEDYASEPEA
ncbi:MAG: hypothetical protein GY913_02990 [Proteobacteria bacterium]|nr:hypothetical protein [Pseudomonadota bacterium]MCP4915865.1 hypothetical protein [Pseudomonadota bacterium]